MSPRNLGNKCCCKCKLIKTLREFSINKKSKDNRQSYCKSCNTSNLLKRRVENSKLKIAITSKECSKCCITKDVSCFSRENSTKDLLRPECKKCQRDYVSNRYKTDQTFRDHVNFRRLISRFRNSGANSDEIDSHRLISHETYNMWMTFQITVRDTKGPIDIDHRWPESKLDINNQLDRLIATNSVNFAPMNKLENIKKSNKIIPSLLLEQVEMAERFMKEVELSEEERIKFKFLTMLYTEYIYSKTDSFN